MDYKYKEGYMFVVQNTQRVFDIKKYYMKSISITDKIIEVGEIATVHHAEDGKFAPYELLFKDGTTSQYLNEKDIDILSGNKTDKISNKWKCIKNTAEEVFADNIGKKILTEVLTDTKQMSIFKGTLVKISCNTFIIETTEGFIEMFRYEDVRYLKVID